MVSSWKSSWSVMAWGLEQYPINYHLLLDNFIPVAILLNLALIWGKTIENLALLWQICVIICSSSLYVRFSYDRHHSVFIVIVNLWSIVSKFFSNILFSCWFCQLSNLNLFAKFFSSLVNYIFSQCFHLKL